MCHFSGFGFSDQKYFRVSLLVEDREFSLVSVFKIIFLSILFRFLFVQTTYQYIKVCLDVNYNFGECIFYCLSLILICGYDFTFQNGTPRHLSNEVTPGGHFRIYLSLDDLLTYEYYIGSCLKRQHIFSK